MASRPAGDFSGRSKRAAAFLSVGHAGKYGSTAACSIMYKKADLGRGPLDRRI